MQQELALSVVTVQASSSGDSVNLLNKLQPLSFLQTIKHISKASNFVCANNKHCNQTSKHYYGLKHIIPNNSFHTSLESSQRQ